MVRASERAEYYPVYYQEPIVEGGIALGFDLGSNPARLEALLQARDTGRMSGHRPRYSRGRDAGRAL